MRQFRIEFRGNTGDRNLIAKFFYAANKQAAMDLALRWLAMPAGTNIRCLVSEV